MSTVELQATASDGSLLKAVFAKDRGMNMLWFSKGATQVMALETTHLFEERFAGLGALIGPHFHRRNPSVLPKFDESKFPHIEFTRKAGSQDPFSHGIGRYAPWKVVSDGSSFQAELSGKDEWNGIPLAQMEGQQFRMRYRGRLEQDGLHLELSVVSDTDSLVGTHFYYGLPENKGTVKARVARHYLDAGHHKLIPKEWPMDADNYLVWNLNEPADYTFFPYPDPLHGKITLDAIAHRLHISYSSDSEESCFQLWRPAGETFVCIEPISALDPRHPNLTVSSIKVHLQIETT